MADQEIVDVIGEWQLLRNGLLSAYRPATTISFDGKSVALGLDEDGDLEIELDGRVFGYVPLAVLLELIADLRERGKAP